jgi:hypothetical protein
MCRPITIPLIIAAAVAPATRSMGEELVTIRVGDQALVSYQAEPLSDPVGGNAFRGSAFIHPLKTPSGFVVTESQPADHLHHFGLWWPWKYIQVGQRKVLCWELQQGDGLIQATETEPTSKGLVTKSIYLDRKAPGGPVPLLQETTTILASGVVDQPARGYFLDVEIVHQPAGQAAITVVPYRYSGFSLRGTAYWNTDNSTILTSDGKDRLSANFTRARWVRVEGQTQQGAHAGVLLMSRPDNQSHPEKLRTWDRQHNGSIFINFNTVMEDPWVFEPGNEYQRHYRIFVYDGEVSTTEAAELWTAYASTADER